MDALNASPQFRQVADTLRRRIQTGEYRPGDTIPTAAQLEKSFAVSNITIRRALAILSAEKLIESQRGRGTFVTDWATSSRVLVALSNDFSEWANSAGGANLEIDQTVLGITTALAPTQVITHFGIDIDTPLWQMRRLRRIGRSLVSYHINYGAADRLNAIDVAAMQGSRKFVDAMREDCGIKLKKMTQTVEAISADRDLAQILETDFGEPIFYVTNVYTDHTDEVVAVSELYLHGRHYAYQTTLTL